MTPVTKFEFLFGKQLPYIGLAFLNFLVLTAFTVFISGTVADSFPTYALAALALCRDRDRNGAGAIHFREQPDRCNLRHGSADTHFPAVQYSGVIDPVSSLQGAGAFIGKSILQRIS